MHSTSHLSRKRVFQEEGQVGGMVPRSGLLGMRKDHSPPLPAGVQTSLRGDPQTPITRHNLQRTCGQARNRRVPILNCSLPPSPHTPGCSPPASTVPFSFASPLLSLSAMPQEQHRTCQQMNSSLPSGAGLPHWVKGPLAELPVGRAILFCTFLKDQGRHRALQNP